MKKCLAGEALYLLEDFAHDLKRNAYCAEQTAKEFQKMIDKERDVLEAAGLKGEQLKDEITKKITEN